ncbi:glyoxalase superfamily protein [Metabacillus sp. B2-18]|uniref:glyoxalase superfamily protein n=1 Tax=Metabacillus sp. B2-18 TaxID=2897333 RepID=UPI001E55F8FD|nr:glyoxalase superfamily protein [Metabacillus sp. B2-18]UGB28780.1 VOC family protein [Metabacillus sp. B2-18]
MVVPIFRIFDLEKAKEFYINFLGFKLDWTHQYEEDMPIYCQVSLNNIVLHLSEHHGDSSPGSTIRIKITNIKKYHSKLQEMKYHYSNPCLEKSPWNTVELTVIDPFFNRITFYEEIL